MQRLVKPAELKAPSVWLDAKHVIWISMD